MSGRRRVAVVGAGVAGLTAAYVLQREWDVTLFEAEPRLGGHAHTHDVVTPDGHVLPIDSGFIVHNLSTYPTLLRLFGELGVETQPTDMSMSVRCDGCGLEYAGAKGLGGIFAQPANATNVDFLRMLVEVKRFHRAARRLLRGEGPTHGRDGSLLTLGEFLTVGRYTPYFRRHFMVPLVSCVWSCAPRTALLYPAASLFTFLDHHGALSVTGSPEWRTVVGGSRSYVERAAKELTATHLATPVRSVRRVGAGIEIRDDADDLRTFDAAVVATHADDALGLLVEPTPLERATLGAFSSSVNETVLHTDGRVLPTHPRARASWNYLLDHCASTADEVHVSYDMNRLHRLEERRAHVVTLNPGGRVADADVLARMHYTHPVYTAESVAAQTSLPRLSDHRLAFAGAYHGWGFHEDGCLSGARAAAALGVEW